MRVQKLFFALLLLLIQFTVFAKNSGDVFIDYLPKDSTHRQLQAIVINSDKRLNVNYLDIKGGEAPMSINVINSNLMRDLNISTLEGVVANIPGVYATNQYGAFQFFTIRGFENFVVLNDGIRDERHNIAQSAPQTNMANVERVEVLKGPSGEFFGHSALGGIVNIVHKKPTKTFTTNSSISVGSYNSRNFVLGMGGSLTNKLLFRIDAGINNSDGWRGVKTSSNNYSGVLQYAFSPNTKLELRAQYNDDNYGADTGTPTDNFGNVVEGIDYKKNYADKSDYIRNRRAETSLKFTHRFDNGSKITNYTAYYYDDIDYMMKEVLFYNPTKKTIGLNNSDYHFNHRTKPISNQLNYNFTFDTWGVKHTALVGNTISYLDRSTIYRNIVGGTSNKDIPIDNFLMAGDAHTTDIDKIAGFNETLIGTYIHDWVEFNSKFKMLLGARFDHFMGEYTAKRSPNDIKNIRKDNFNNLSYRVAFSYLPMGNFMNIYLSASNYFKPARLAHHGKNSEPFKPEKGIQTEAGIKLNKKNLLTLDLSAYFIEKSNVVVGHQILSQVGGATAKGVELDAEITPIKDLYIKLGYSLNDTKFIDKNQKSDAKDIVGKQLPRTPMHSFNSWINYNLPAPFKGLGVGAGVYYVGKTFQNATNTQYLPAYTIANAALHYRFDNGVRLALNVDNLFDKLYYRGALSDGDLWSENSADEVYQSKMQAYPGKGRNFQLTLSYKF